MVTKDMKQRAALYPPVESVAITMPLIEQFLNSITMCGRQPQTVRTYRRGLVDLYAFLPEKKEITKEALAHWRESLKESGYSDKTINTKLVAVNGLLRYCGTEELTATHTRIAPGEDMPEMTREEYLQLLSKVREIGSEKGYFLIKVFASVDISVGRLEYLTVEACREGSICMSNEKAASIPTCLSRELLQFADRHGILNGPVFVTREGNLMNRSNIANSLRRLAVQAEMDPDKCCPSALHRLYLTTQGELKARLQPLFVQSYESLLNTEQTVVAWR